MTFLYGDRTGPSARGRRGPASPAGARFCMSGRVSQRSLMWSRRARHTSATSDWKRGSATISSGPIAAGRRDAAAGCFGDGGAQAAQHAGEGILGTHPAALGGHADPGHGLAVHLTAAHRPVEQVLQATGKAPHVFRRAKQHRVCRRDLPPQFGRSRRAALTVVVGVERRQASQPLIRNRRHLPGRPERAVASAAVSVEPRRVSGAPAARADRAPASSGLTERERQVLELLAEALTNRRIAKTLFTSEKTVSPRDAHPRQTSGE